MKLCQNVLQTNVDSFLSFLTVFSTFSHLSQGLAVKKQTKKVELKQVLNIYRTHSSKPTLDEPALMVCAGSGKVNGLGREEKSRWVTRVGN